MPDAGRAQARQIEALALIGEFDGLNQTPARLIVRRLQGYLLFAFGPCHHQFVLTTLEKAEEEIFRRNPKRRRRGVIRRAINQVVADEGRHDSVFERGRKGDPLGIPPRFNFRERGSVKHKHL